MRRGGGEEGSSRNADRTGVLVGVGGATHTLLALSGFTRFTESADAEDVMALLRDYHAAIGEIIIKYNGTLERYAGDGVMVVFNDPVPVEKPALQAGLWPFKRAESLGGLTARGRRPGR